jgi:two-component system NtrC family sensor kinase
MEVVKNKVYRGQLEKYKAEVKTKDRLLTSINKISGLLNRPIQWEKILQQLVKEMKRVFDLQRVVIFLINKKENTLEVKYVVGFSPDEVKRAFKYPLDMNKHQCRETLVAKTGRTIYIRDAHRSSIITEFDFKMDRVWNRTSSISMPMKIKGEIVGVLQGDSTTKELIFSKEDIKMFSSFASQASIIIENARLHEQAQKKIDQLMFLHSVTEKTSSTLNLGKLVDIITANANRISQGRCCALLLMDRDKRYLRVASWKGDDLQDTDRIRVRVGENISGWVAEKGVPLLINDVTQEPRYSEIHPNIASMLSVPLISENNVLGVITVTSEKKAAFSLDDLELLMTLAGHAAALINNVRLYDQMKEERNVVADILESSPSGIVAVDQHKKITSFNRRAEEILQMKRKSVLGKKYGDVFRGEFLDIFDQIVEQQAVPDNAEIRYPRQDGDAVLLGVTSSLLKNRDSAAIGTIVSIQDLTEFKKTEELIRRMDKLSSLGQLSAGLAHEIRNPLASINFNVQLIEKHLEDNKSAKSIMHDTLEGIERIKILVKRVLDFTKTGTPAFSPGDIHESINDALELIAPQIRKKNILIKKDYTAKTGSFVFDPHQMQQVFVNLLLNATEATPEGGTIEIRSATEKVRQRGADTHVITITDNGQGISPDNISKIFDPFFTTKPEGTGLGLSIVHKILEQHEASIDIESKENKGSSFSLRFPAKKVVSANA